MNVPAITPRDCSDDYALLVGVSDYPHTGYSKLNGPANDIDQMKSWLVHPDGGNVPVRQIKILQSPHPVLADSPVDYPPTDREAWAWLKSVVFTNNQVRERLNGRLYLFFSGHGFSNFMATHLAALYMGNADKVQPFHVCGTNMASWCAAAAAFGEIVLVMDCCRDQEIAKNVEPAPFIECRSPAAKDVKVLEIYAVPYDGKAQERGFKRSGGKVLGILTYALQHALWSAPTKMGAYGGGVRDGYAIKSFIEGIWGTIVSKSRIEAPEIVLPRRGDIVFGVGPCRPIEQSIRFSPRLGAACSLEIVNSDGKVVDLAVLDPLAGTCAWQVAGGVAQRFDGECVVVSQMAGPYEAILKRVGAPDLSASFNMLGEDDVHFDI